MKEIYTIFYVGSAFIMLLLINAKPLLLITDWYNYLAIIGLPSYKVRILACYMLVYSDRCFIVWVLCWDGTFERCLPSDCAVPMVCASWPVYVPLFLISYVKVRHCVHFEFVSSGLTGGTHGESWDQDQWMPLQNWRPSVMLKTKSISTRHSFVMLVSSGICCMPSTFVTHQLPLQSLWNTKLCVWPYLNAANWFLVCVWSDSLSRVLCLLAFVLLPLFSFLFHLVSQELSTEVTAGVRGNPFP